MTNEISTHITQLNDTQTMILERTIIEEGNPKIGTYENKMHKFQEYQIKPESMDKDLEPMMITKHSS